MKIDSRTGLLPNPSDRFVGLCTGIIGLCRLAKAKRELTPTRAISPVLFEKTRSKRSAASAHWKSITTTLGDNDSSDWFDQLPSNAPPRRFKYPFLQPPPLRIDDS